MNRWWDRKDKAKKQLGKFSRGTLKKLLGKGFDDITTIFCIRQWPQSDSDIPPSRLALAEASPNSNASVISTEKFTLSQSRNTINDEEALLKSKGHALTNYKPADPLSAATTPSSSHNLELEANQQRHDQLLQPIGT